MTQPDTDTSNCLRPLIIYSNQQYCVWDQRSLEILRRTYRIIGSFVGCPRGTVFQTTKSGLPFKLTLFETKLLVEENLASVCELKLRQENETERQTNPHERLELYERHIQDCYSKANDKFRQTKKEQMLLHDVNVDERKLGNLNRARMKVPVDYLPNEQFSNYIVVEMSKSKVESMMKNDLLPLPLTADDSQTQQLKNKYLQYRVFKDLWSKHLFVSPGLKFGCDYLAYQGEPLIYHSTYAVRVVRDNLINLDNWTQHDFGEIQFYINSFQRMCYNTHKIPLFAFVIGDAVVYKTIDQKDTLDYGVDPNNILRDYLIPHRPGS